jgi:hypothetical protein
LLSGLGPVTSAGSFLVRLYRDSSKKKYVRRLRGHVIHACYFSTKQDAPFLFCFPIVRYLSGCAFFPSFSFLFFSFSFFLFCVSFFQASFYLYVFLFYFLCFFFKSIFCMILIFFWISPFYYILNLFPVKFIFVSRCIAFCSFIKKDLFLLFYKISSINYFVPWCLFLFLWSSFLFPYV